MKEEETKRIKVQAYSPGELAELYDVDARTLKRWLEPFKQQIGERQGRYFNTTQVKTIFTLLSLPCYIVVE